MQIQLIFIFQILFFFFLNFEFLSVFNFQINYIYQFEKGAWFLDLKDRIEFLKTWENYGIPPAFWISGFYFPQAFLTGTLQNFARKYVVSIDAIDFSFQVILTNNYLIFNN